MNETLQLPPMPTAILGISNVTVQNVEITEDNEFVITVKSTNDEIKCKKCNNTTSPHGRARAVRLRHLPIFDNETYIQISPIRGICNKCDGNPTTIQESDWYNSGSSYTKAYERNVLLSLINSTIADVSMKEGLGYKAVEGIIDRYIETEVNWDNVQTIGLFGIDEISLKKGYKDYVTVLTSRSEQGIRILGIIKGREKADIKRFFNSIPMHLRKTIIAICSDMYDGFINAAKEVFGGDIPVVADRYHVSKLYRKSLVALRKKELKRLKKSLPKEKYHELKPAISLLRKRKECEINEQEKEVLKPLFDVAPKIKKAYSFSLQLTAIYNKHSTTNEALESLNSWISEVEKSDINCFKDFIKTLKKYKAEICNYFIGRHNSGFVEGCNNKIKVLKRRCYGIFNIKHLFQRIVLDFSGYNFLGVSNLVKI